ncbi:hypothetical protein OG21DRAFT_1528206 [Imleria badia]|nr:hypothetical protein OG21DRAFT_1528206 [Imleria badia]
MLPGPDIVQSLIVLKDPQTTMGGNEMPAVMPEDVKAHIFPPEQHSLMGWRTAQHFLLQCAFSGREVATFTAHMSTLLWSDRIEDRGLGDWTLVRDLWLFASRDWLNSSHLNLMLGAMYKKIVALDPSVELRPPTLKPKLLEPVLERSRQEPKKTQIEVEFGKAGRNLLKARLDHAVVKLVCAATLPPTIVDTSEWKDIFSIANNMYCTGLRAAQ